MGYDVTFHPVSRAELQRFVFDVVGDPALASVRATELAPDPDKREVALDVYEQMSAWNGQDVPFNATYGVVAAIVAGFLHPYWYVRGQAVSFLAQQDPSVHELLVPLPRIAEGAVGSLKDPSCGLITDNYTASGLLENLDEFLVRFQKHLRPQSKLAFWKKPPLALELFSEDGIQALEYAVRYAQAKRLGLMEATDVVVPFAEEFRTDPDNLRAHYLKRLDP